MEPKKRIILVLGIHRSGTSVLTKGLETMNISLGHSLLEANPFNEKGHWEDVEFHDFNVSMLDALGNRLRRILPLTEEEVILLCQKGFLTKASQLLFEKISSSDCFAFKDPKCSLLLPFWKKVFQECNIHASFVIALRDPWSVVFSNKLYCQIENEEMSFWMWISYLLSCLEYSEGHQRILVDYNELLIGPEYQMQRIAKALKLTLHSEALQSYCHDFVDSSLCHFQKEKKHSFTSSFYQQFALEIYETLLRIARDKTSFHAIHILFEKWKKQFSRASSLLVLAEKNNFTIKELEKTIINHQNTVFELDKTVNKKLHAIASFCDTLHQRNLQLISLAQELTKRDHNLFQLTQRLEEQRCTMTAGCQLHE